MTELLKQSNNRRQKQSQQLREKGLLSQKFPSKRSKKFVIHNLHNLPKKRVNTKQPSFYQPKKDNMWNWRRSMNQKNNNNSIFMRLRMPENRTEDDIEEDHLKSLEETNKSSENALPDMPQEETTSEISGNENIDLIVNSPENTVQNDQKSTSWNTPPIYILVTVIAIGGLALIAFYSQREIKRKKTSSKAIKVTNR